MVKISVIVPCYNAAGHLKNLLESLKKQTLPNSKFEVIIVDDGSTDGTAAIAKKYPFAYLFQKNKGAGPARNFGAKKARGKIFLFTDSDCVVPRTWVEKHLVAHQGNKEVGIVAGGVKKPREKGYVVWTDFLSTWFNAHEDLEKHIVSEYIPSLNISVKKESFLKVGSFWKKRLTGEDVEFFYRARKRGIKTLFDPSLAIWHKNHDLPTFFKHNFNWGYHAPFVRGEHKGLAYHFLFSGGFLKALVFFLPIVFGYTLLIGAAWLRYQPLRLLVCLPLIFLGKIYYGFGFISGSWHKNLAKND